MKVIRTDTFDRAGEVQGHDEKLIASGLTEVEAIRKASGLNSIATNGYHYMVRPESYQLKEFKP